MCKIDICRPILALLLTVAFSLVATTAPSDTELALELPVPPDTDEVVLLDELVEWVDCGDRLAADCLGAEPLRDTIRARPASFELFRNFHDRDARASQLAELPFGELIRKTAERQGVDPLLVAAIIEAESGFDPRAVSHRGALGLMQVHPINAGERQPDELFDPEVNVDLGVGYLRSLLERYDGDLELALAAYNAGPTNVRRYGGLPPFRETRNYVEKVLARYVEHHTRVWQSSKAGERLALL